MQTNSIIGNSPEAVSREPYRPSKKEDKKSSQTSSDQDVESTERLQDFVKKVESFYTAYNEPIYRARNYLTFLYVDQWDYQVRADRENMGKPTLSFNKLVPIIRAILGEERKNTPSVSVRDITTNLTVPQHEVDMRTDLMREIFYCSDMDIILQIAFKNAIETGWGAAHVTTRYETATSYNQIIEVRPIADYQAAFWDPVAQEHDKSDGLYCGVYSVVSKEQFTREYPDIEVPISMPAGNMQYYLPWNDQEAVVICEIYVKEYFKKKCYLLSNGQEVDEDEAKAFFEKQEKDYKKNPALKFLQPNKVEIEQESTRNDYKIKHIKFVANAILEETDYPGKRLPIPYCEGDTTIIDGKRIPLPFVQDAIDAQKTINYVLSEMVYAVLRSRKETIWATLDNMKGFEKEYANPDQVQGAMPFNPDGRTGAAPIVTPPTTFSPQLLEMLQNATMDLQQITGRYEESRGESSNAIAAVAIRERKQAGNNVVNVYQDNLNRFLKSISLIILDLMPHIYDNERTIVVRGADNKTKKITINKPKGFHFTGNDEDSDFKPNLENDMSKGRYDVEVRVDGSFDQQNQASMEFFMQLAAGNPQLGPLMYDLMAKVSGLENAQQLYERFKTLVPPDILAKESGMPPPPPPPPPPPDPGIQMEQIKAQSAAAANQVRMQELAVKEMEIQMKAKELGIKHIADITRAQAEVKKSNNDKETAAIDHASTVVDSHSKLLQSIQEAEIKRAALNQQAKVFKTENNQNKSQ